MGGECKGEAPNGSPSGRRKRENARLRGLTALLHQSQADIVFAPLTADRLIVSGPAGTGETVVAVHRVAYLITAAGVQQEEILILGSPSVKEHATILFPELHMGRSGLCRG